MLRVPMIILAVLYLAFSAFTALVGAFANGGTIPERILISLIHPTAAILLLMAVVSFSKPISTGLHRFTLVLLLVAIAADLTLAVVIGVGVVKGDWFLPLVFAVVPVIGVAYLAAGAKTTWRSAYHPQHFKRMGVVRGPFIRSRAKPSPESPQRKGPPLPRAARLDGG